MFIFYKDEFFPPQLISIDYQKIQRFVFLGEKNNTIAEIKKNFRKFFIN